MNSKVADAPGGDVEDAVGGNDGNAPMMDVVLKQLKERKEFD